MQENACRRPRGIGLPTESAAIDILRMGFRTRDVGYGDLLERHLRKTLGQLVQHLVRVEWHIRHIDDHGVALLLPKIVDCRSEQPQCTSCSLECGDRRYSRVQDTYELGMEWVRLTDLACVRNRMTRTARQGLAICS